MKIKHSELTKRILADRYARESFFRVMSSGIRNQPVTLAGKRYYLIPSWAASREEDPQGP